MKKNTPKRDKQPSSRYHVKIIKYIRSHSVGFSIVLLLTLGFITRFWLFGYPNQTVFDEVYFGKFVSSYFTGQYFFDIHPPFAKLLIAGFAKLMGYNPTSSFASIGTEFSDNGYLYLRFLPSLAGALLPLVLFGIARELGFKTRTALIIGMLVVFDTALLAQSRFILIDSLLVLFGFASLWLFLIWRRRKIFIFLLLATILAGMAISIKWIALPFIFLPVLYEFINYASVKRIIKILAIYCGVPLILYLAFFTIHISLLTKSGDGDAFMSPAYQHTLEGNAYATDDSQPNKSLPSKIYELNHEMYSANNRIAGGHPYGSRWYGWPIVIKPISYWAQGDAQIWLVGNPFIWWSGIIAVIWLIITLFKKHMPNKKLPVALFLLLSFLVTWLPFALISRVMFLYHYFIPLCFSILIIGFFIEKISQKKQYLFIALVASSFLIFAPVAYGLTFSQLFVNIRSAILVWQ